MSFTTLNDRLTKLKDTLYQCFFGKPRKSRMETLKYRSLQLDTLESRELLSVSVTTPYDVPVSQIDPRTILIDRATDTLVAQPSIIAGTNQSVAGSNNGDFVVAWTLEEPVWIRNWSGTPETNPNYGNPILDAITGDYQPYTNVQTGEIIWESNVYARYLTDEVQRITLPSAFNAPLNAGSRYNNFTLQYGTTIQKLSFTTSNIPEYSADRWNYDNQITSTLTFWFPANGIDQPLVRAFFNYDEAKGPDANAKILHDVIQGMGQYTAKVKVTATSAREFVIEFTDNYWKQVSAPEIIISDLSPFLGTRPGFLESARVDTIQRPVIVGNVFGDYRTVEQAVGGYTPANTPANLPCIIMDQNNALQTAANIKFALMYAMSYTDFYSPINPNLDPGLGLNLNVGVGNILRLPSYAEFGSTNPSDVASVEVIPVGKPGDPDYGLVFDITFTNDFGKLDIPELLIVSAVDRTGVQHVDRTKESLNNLDLYGRSSYKNTIDPPVTTLKQNSDVFRVNPWEPINPATPYLDVLRQSNPVVAMDADGDFIIAWEATSGKYLKPFSLYNPYDQGNVYARTFSPQAILSEADAELFKDGFKNFDGKAVQGVRPTSDEIQINKGTQGVQNAPSIACDRYGNFVIAWNSISGQDFSYYQGVQARWFDRDGRPTTSDVPVSPDTTNPTNPPRVGMSENGMTIIAWSYGFHNMGLSISAITIGDLYKNVYDVNRSTFTPTNPYNPIVEVIPEAGTYDAVLSVDFSFDSSGRYVMSYSIYNDFYNATLEPLANGPPTPRLERTVVTQMYAPVYGLEVDGYPIIGETKVGAEKRITYEETRLEREYWDIGQMGTSVSVDADGDYLVIYPGSWHDVDLDLIWVRPLYVITDSYGLRGEQVNPTNTGTIDTSTGRITINTKDDSIVYYHTATTTGVGGKGGVNVAVEFDPQRWKLFLEQYVFAMQDGNPTKNEDLFFFLQNPPWGGDAVASDVDAVIRDYLIQAQHYGATVEQLSRLSSFLEFYLGLLRGSSNDLLFTFYDAEASMVSRAYLGHNLIANNSRAGVDESTRNTQNTRQYLAVPGPAAFWDPGHPGNPPGDPGIRGHYWDLPSYSISYDIIVEGMNGSPTGRMQNAVTVRWNKTGYDTENNIAVGTWVVEYDVSLVNINYLDSSQVWDREGTLWDFGYQSEWTSLYNGNWDIGDAIWAKALALFEVTFVDKTHDLYCWLVPHRDQDDIVQRDPYPDGYYEYDDDGNPTFVPNDPGERFIGVGKTNTVFEQYGNDGVSRVNLGSNMSKKGDFSVVYAEQMTYQRSQQGGYIDDSYLLPQSGTIGKTPVHINFRNFSENTDSAGAYVTDFYNGLGKYMKEGQTIDTADLNTGRIADLNGVAKIVGQMVVSFDEKLRTMDMDPLHAVDNPANWELLCNGVPVPNAIANIAFGLNKGRDLGFGGKLNTGTNVYDAVITFNIAFQEASQYTLVPKNTIYDIAGNGINKNGVFDYLASTVAPSGLSPVDQRLFLYKTNTITFNVGGSNFKPGDKDPEPVDPGGNGQFRDKDDEIGPKGIASDAEGNYVIAWTQPEVRDQWGNVTRQSMIYVQKYYADGTPVPGGKHLVATALKGETVSQAAVAMDADGDFVVAWTQGKQKTIIRPDKTVDRIYEESNIFYSYFIEKDGSVVPGEFDGRTVFQANTYSLGVQQHPAVAMDADGDYIIVWESQGQENRNTWDWEEFGWGIYGQRFSPFSSTDNNRLGGRNAVQELVIINGNEGATFYLEFTPLDYNGNPLVKTPYRTAAISVHLNTFEMEDAVARELESLFRRAGLVKGSEPVVSVRASGLGSITSSDKYPGLGNTLEYQAKISIEYIGELASQAVTWDSTTSVGLGVMDVKPNWSTFTNRGGDVRMNDRVYGDSGEFLVNQTTIGDQRYPSVAMSLTGEFVVSWTGWTRNPQTQVQTSDIYARNFTSNHIIRSYQQQFDPDNQIYNNVTPGPSQLTEGKVDVGLAYSGVVAVGVGDDLVGSGALLTSRYHVLTAAHIVTDPTTGLAYDPNDKERPIIVTFATPDGPEIVKVNGIILNPDQEDLAILVLAGQAPLFAESYELYQGTDELGKDMTFVGYGGTGNRLTGAGDSNPVKASGMNRYDDIYYIVNEGVRYPTNPNWLMYDLDSEIYHRGIFTRNNLWGNVIGGPGLGNREAIPLLGDFGGPSFINGKIAGVTSGTIQYDPWYGLDGSMIPPEGWVQSPYSFGATGYDVRVSSYVGWINGVLAGGSEEMRVNEWVYDPNEVYDPTSSLLPQQTKQTLQYPGGDQMWSDVAMDALGNFVVTWTSFGTWTSFDVGNIEFGRSFYIETPLVCARRFVADQITGEVQPYGSQFFVSSILDRDSFTLEEVERVNSYLYSSYVVSRGDYMNADPDSNRFAQLHSKVDITPKGDFCITWEERDAFSGTFDVYIRNYLNTTDYQKYVDQDGPRRGYWIGLDRIPVDLTNDTVRMLNLERGYGGFLYRAEGGALDMDYNVTGRNRKINNDKNDYRAGNVALNSNGDAIIAWQNSTEGGIMFIRGRRYVGIDSAGNHIYSKISAPFVADVVAYSPNSPKNGQDDILQQILDQSEIRFGPTHIIVTMSEEVYHQNVNNLASVLNKNNWALWKDGIRLPANAIVSINFGRNAAFDSKLIDYKSHKFEIVLELDGNPYDRAKPGPVPLFQGNYRLTLSSNVTDVDTGNPNRQGPNRLDGGFNGRSDNYSISGPDGKPIYTRDFKEDFEIRFTIGKEAGILVLDSDPTRPTDPKPGIGAGTDEPVFKPLPNGSMLLHDNPAIAVREDGAYIIVGKEHFIDEDGIPRSKIVVKHFDAYGNPIGQHDISAGYDSNLNITLSDYYTQSEPSIAMDKYGNYVVTWVVTGTSTNGGTVYSRAFDRYGNPLTEYDVQVPIVFGPYYSTPKVALGDDGTYVVCWITNNPQNNALAIYTRAFDLYGRPLSEQQIVATFPWLNQNGVEITTDGKGNFVVAWYAYDTSNNTTNIFARTFTLLRGKDGNVSYQFGTAFRVNTYILGTQETPKISMSNNGTFVITWQGIHSGAQDKSGYGVYARAFQFSTSATPKSIPIGGTTSDFLVNQNTKNDQRMPDVAISGDGLSMVFTWASYDQEPDNRDPYKRTPIHDYGIIARYFVMNTQGTGYVDPYIKPTGSSTTNRANYYAGEFLVNRILNGNQVSPVVGMDWDGDYTISWVSWGPIINQPLLPSPDDPSGAPQMYQRSYRPNGVGSKPVTSQTVAAGTKGITTMSDKNNTGTTRASGGGYQAATVAVVGVFTITGTSGNDLLEIIPGMTAGSWTVKLNGVVQNIPAGTTQVAFDGKSGNNTIRFTGTDAAETVALDVDAKTLKLGANGLTFSGSNFGVLQIDGKGGYDTLSVVTASKGTDTIDLAVGLCILNSNVMKAEFANFENVKLTSGGGKDVVVMRDSEKEAQLKMMPKRSVMEGAGFHHEVNGFAYVNAVSTSGMSVAVLEGSSVADTLNADEYSVVLSNGSVWNRASGFRSVTINGQGSGNVANINGSTRGGDYYCATASSSEMYYSSGQSLIVGGFQRTNVNASHGSYAYLEGGIGFKGYADQAIWTGIGFHQTLQGFSSTTVKAVRGAGMTAYLDLSADVDATLQGVGNAISVNLNGLDLYHLIAFDQVQAKKEAGGTSGKVMSTTDYLFTTGDWEEVLETSNFRF